MSIAACNTRRVEPPKLELMHASAERLYQAAKELRQTEGQSAVGRLLNQSAQTMNNWEARGVSKQGALIAEKELGVSPNWVLSGDGDMRMPPTQPPPPAGEFGAGAEAAPDQARQRLLERLRTADAATVRLVELALLDDKDNGAAAARLSPSLRGLVGFLKQQIAAEIASHDNT